MFSDTIEFHNNKKNKSNVSVGKNLNKPLKYCIFEEIILKQGLELIFRC